MIQGPSCRLLRLREDLVCMQWLAFKKCDFSDNWLQVRCKALHSNHTHRDEKIPLHRSVLEQRCKVTFKLACSVRSGPSASGVRSEYCYLS